MYSTFELDELFQILNLIEKNLNLKGLEPHWSNTIVFTPYITNIMVQHNGCILSISTILNYLPIIAPDYHPFVNIKGMYYLLIWIFLPDTVHEILFHSRKCR